MKIVYRQLTLADAEQYLNLVNEVKDEGKYLFFSSRFDLETTEKRIEQQTQKLTFFYGAFENDKLIGWIDYSKGAFSEIEHTAYIGMGVQKEKRGLGIGKILMDKCIEKAKENQIEKIELEVFSSNENAVRLYKNKGFKEQGRFIKKRKYENKYDDIICMYKFI